MIDDYGDAKLSDFGISRMLESRGFTTKTVAGTVRWMALELLLDEDETSEDAIPVTVESDVWSFGMTILEVSMQINRLPTRIADTELVQVLTGRMPFFEFKHDTHVLLSVMRGKIPRRPEIDAITDDIWHLLTSCWDQNPKSRPSVKNITCFLWDSYERRGDLDMYQEGTSPCFEGNQPCNYDGTHHYPVYPRQPSEYTSTRGVIQCG